MARFKKKNSQTAIGWGVGIALLVFAVLGTTFLIIGYHDTMFEWMKTTGLVILILSVIPITYIIKYIIDSKHQV